MARGAGSFRDKPAEQTPPAPFPGLRVLKTEGREPLSGSGGLFFDSGGVKNSFIG
ncbi:MAG: hypothetical protein LBR53_05845 [Deltaproteobacteria bacterium]|nr:hypothetical protein [Deltaproteobacteria bacterium]